MTKLLAMCCIAIAKHLDDSIRALGVQALQSPVASPKANAICERVMGTARRECLDGLIPMSEAQLRAILKCWVTHYNGGRPVWSKYSSLLSIPLRAGPWSTRELIATD